MPDPIGILGGTFDPVHHGHLRMAIECYERLGLSEVRLTPLHTPPHRQTPFASPDHRLTMLELAIQGMDGLSIDTCELFREEISYTIDTVISVRQKEDETPLCLLMGTDAFYTLHTWRNWQSLLDYVHIVIAERPGSQVNFPAAELNKLMNKHKTSQIDQLRNQSNGKIFELVIPILDISSSQIRNVFSRKTNPACLLPDNVIDYIYRHNIYQTG